MTTKRAVQVAVWHATA